MHARPTPALEADQRFTMYQIERQLAETSSAVSVTSATHEPSSASRLHRSTSVSEEDAGPVSSAAAGVKPAALPTVTDELKDE